MDYLICSQFSLYRSRRVLYCLLDITEFRYKWSLLAVWRLWGNIHFDINGHFVITEFDITEVDNKMNSCFMSAKTNMILNTKAILMNTRFKMFRYSPHFHILTHNILVFTYFFLDKLGEAL